MKRVALSVMLTASTIALPVYGQSINEILDTTITLQQTDGFIGTLSGGQTHHVMGPRLNFRVPTRTINVVSFTPPSLETGCAGTSFNLGNFSIISLDEAIALLRQIAAQSLNFAFGQALQAMCQPCYAGMNDLKKQLNAFNMNAKNTCHFAEAFVNDWGIEEKVGNLTKEVCTSQESAIGTDSAICQGAAGISGLYDGFVDTVTGWNTTLTAAGGDIDADFKIGNVMYEMYHRIDPTNQRYQSMDILKIFLGVDAGTPLLPWQVAASFYGTSGVMSNDQGKTVSYDGPTIPNIESLVSYSTNRASTEDALLKFYECSVTPVANPLVPQCAELQKVGITQSIGVCSASSVFADDGTPIPNETFNDYLNCETTAMLNDFTSGNIFAVSTTNSLVRKHLLSLLSRQQQRALIYSSRGEIQQIKSQVADKLTKYVESALLYDVFNDFHQNHINMSQIARTKISGMEEELKAFDSSVYAFKIELQGLKQRKEDAYDELNKITAWNALVLKYEKDMSEELSSLVSGR